MKNISRIYTRFDLNDKQPSISSMIGHCQEVGWQVLDKVVPKNLLSPKQSLNLDFTFQILTPLFFRVRSCCLFVKKLHGFHADYFRNELLNIPLYALFKCHLGHGTTGAGTF